MSAPNIVDQQTWLTARLELLEQEKAFTRARDELSHARRQMPWVKIDKDYRFTTNDGEQSLAELFAGRSQLMVYHFMFHPDWEQPCKSCALWADNYNGTDIHLAHRDVSFVVVSRAPLEKLNAVAKRLHWNFNWVSSGDSDFNRDFQVSFEADELDGEVYYNYSQTRFPALEAPGVSVFVMHDAEVYHSYSCYSRGLDILNGTYNHLDMTPKGRDEDGLSYGMEWLRLKDQYD